MGIMSMKKGCTCTVIFATIMTPRTAKSSLRFGTRKLATTRKEKLNMRHLLHTGKHLNMRMHATADMLLKLKEAMQGKVVHCSCD